MPMKGRKIRGRFNRSTVIAKVHGRQAHVTLVTYAAGLIDQSGGVTTWARCPCHVGGTPMPPYSDSGTVNWTSPCLISSRAIRTFRGLLDSDSIRGLEPRSNCLFRSAATITSRNLESIPGHSSSLATLLMLLFAAVFLSFIIRLAYSEGLKVKKRNKDGIRTFGFMQARGRERSLLSPKPPQKAGRAANFWTIDNSRDIAYPTRVICPDNGGSF